MVDICFSCWRPSSSNVVLLSPSPSKYLNQLKCSPKRRRSERQSVVSSEDASSSTGSETRQTRSAVRMTKQSERNRRRKSLDESGLRQTSRRCRRRSRDANCSRISVSGSRSRLPVTSSGVGILFGRPLADICQPDLPEPVIQMLVVLYERGPQSNGLFRRSANHTKCQSAKLTLDTGRQFDFNDTPLPVTAALLKEFLRCLPDCLLTSDLYHSWIDVADISSQSTCNDHIKRLVSRLPVSHQRLLQYLLVVLRRVCDNAQSNEMTSYNVAACIGQCLLWPHQSHDHMSSDNRLVAAKKLNLLVQKIIDGAHDIFDTCDCLPFLQQHASSSESGSGHSNKASGSSAESSPDSSDQSRSSASTINDSFSSGRIGRWHSLAVMQGSRTVDDNSGVTTTSYPHLPFTRRTRNRSSNSSTCSSLYDSGCNSSGGSDTLLADHTEVRPVHLRSDLRAETGSSHLQEDESSANDSGYHNSVLAAPLNSASVHGCNYETTHNGDADSLQKVSAGAQDANVTESSIITGKSDHQISGSLDAVQRFGDAKCLQNCATKSGKVMVTRKTRRSSMLARQQQEKLCSRSRRRHSLMLPNGADVYPSHRFSVGFAWPTIVEEETQLTAESNDRSARKSQTKCEDTVLADLREFRATFTKLSEVDSSKLIQDPPLKGNRFVIFDADSHSADFPSCGASDLQLAYVKSGQTDTDMTPQDRVDSVSDVEGTFADLKALGVELGKTTCIDERNPSPSPPVARNPPSYNEALLQQAMRRRSANFIESEMPVTCQHSPFGTAIIEDGAHLLTSSALSDVTESINEGCGRPPPPPYQLRPRRHNDDDEIHNPMNRSPVQGLSGKGSATSQSSERKNGLQPADARAANKDRNSPNLRPSGSFQSPLRRRDSAQKENFYSSKTADSLAAGKGLVTRSPRDTSRKNSSSPRNSALLKRRSLTVRDRDWHRELVHQYN